jgi:hypothetical protein
MLPLVTRAASSSSAAPAFADLKLASDRRLAISALALLVLPALWFIRTDLALFWGDWPHLGARFAARVLMVLLPVAGILVLRTAGSREVYSSRLFAVATGIALAYLAINALRPAASGVPLRTPLLAVAVMYAALPNSILRQVTPPLIVTAGLFLMDVTWLRQSGYDVAGDGIVLLVFNLAGILVVRRRVELEHDVEQAWGREQEARLAAEQALGELHLLRGIIPICAHCKNVRTEVGDWQQIEQYVRDHSEAEFSHGICPTCLTKYYPTVSTGSFQR